jgi:hypothetical protein
MPRRERPGAAGPRPAPTENEAAFWREVKSGDFISISDPEAFEASLASGGGAALDYRVGDIRVFALRGRDDFTRNSRPAPKTRSQAFATGPRLGEGEYRFIELSPASAPEGLRGSARGSAREGSGPLYLAAISFPGREPGGEDFELRLYFIPSGLESGTRDDYIDRGDAWLFLPPPDPEDFISSELEYAPYPDVPPIEEKGEERKLVFSRVGPGCLYAEASDTLAPAIIAEYSAEYSAEYGGAEYGGAETPEGERAPANPLMLVLEEGWMREDGSEPEEGGYLTVMLGKVMRTSDLEHWPA